MTSVFSAEGVNVPCTVIEVGPCVVTQVKTADRDGYEAIQLGCQYAKDKHTTRPMQGHFKSCLLYTSTFGGYSVTMVARDDLSFTLSHSIL